MTAKGADLPMRLKLFHGIGSIAYGIKDNGFSTFLLIFYNQVIGLDASAVSFALMLALFLDAFADPVIGYLSDRTYTRWGQRLPWLYLAPIPLAFAWLLMWAPPQDLGNGIFVYLVLVAILVRTLVSCCEVPSIALLPELTHDYDERTGLMRYRFLFAWAGGLIALYLAYAVFLVPDETHKNGVLNAKGYWSYAVFGALMMAGSVLISAFGQHRRIAHFPKVKPEKSSLTQAFAEIRESFSHRAFRILMVGGMLAYTSQGITFSLTTYLYLYVWQFSDSAFQLYPLILFASVVGAFFLVSQLNRRIGKQKTAVRCGLIGLAVWLSPFGLRALGLWPDIGSWASTLALYAFAYVATVLSITVMITGSSMMADVVEASQIETGRRTEGLFFAGGLFMQKCATGLGIGLSGLIVTLSGLPAKAVPGQVDPSVLNIMIAGYAALIFVLASGAAMAFHRFPISRADHEERVRQLALVPEKSGN
jgi:glycoside/pentoside/hexuronide:cation symporter, GPH family